MIRGSYINRSSAIVWYSPYVPWQCLGSGMKEVVYMKVTEWLRRCLDFGGQILLTKFDSVDAQTSHVEVIQMTK